MTTYLFPTLAGICFGVVGLSYRLGQARGLATPMVVLHMTLAGVLFFGFRLNAESFAAPVIVWMLAIVAGLAQYASIELVAAALIRGPLSPIWCALNLVFVPVIIYSRLALGETLDIYKVAGIAFAIASVVSGSQRSADTGGTATPTRFLPYLSILVAALLCNSILHGSIKHLDAVKLMGGHGSFFFCIMYLCLGLPILVKLFATGFGGTFSLWGFCTGLLAAFGSIAGFSLIAASASAPAAIVFTFSSIFSLISGALISVAFFREKVTVWWMIMLTLAIAAVIMVSIS